MALRRGGSVIALLVFGLTACESTLPEIPRSSASRGAPPPISGGTLLVARDGRTAIAADPDRDSVWIVDLPGRAVRAVVLQPGDEPGRLVEDQAGRVHVALRSGGALVSIAVDTGAEVLRREVCPAPRGVAYDAARDLLHVACAGGELVSLPASGGAATRRLLLDRDLRDVLVQGDRLLVSRFKAAELLEIDAEGHVVSRTEPAVHIGHDQQKNELRRAPRVAWRTVALPDGSALMLHQLVRMEPVSTERWGYIGTVWSARTTLRPGEQGPPVPLSDTWQVDAAVSPDGTKLAVASPTPYTNLKYGNSIVSTRCLLTQPGGACSPFTAAAARIPLIGQATAVAFDGGGRVVAQFREPAALCVDGEEPILLSREGRQDPGHGTFHWQPKREPTFPQIFPSFGPACANCHPEGDEDGRVWEFAGLGPRRTQSLRGGILATAPFHWHGELSDLPQLVSEVFAKRMGGHELPPEQVTALGRWLDTLPALPPTLRDPAAARRGGELFHDAQVGCATCHGGALLTSNASEDVGTGGRFQVPSLRGVASRAPYLHDGCAATLRHRFGPCGGGDRHGRTSHLTAQQIDDLVAYLEGL